MVERPDIDQIEARVNRRDLLFTQMIHAENHGDLIAISDADAAIAGNNDQLARAVPALIAYVRQLENERADANALILQQQGQLERINAALADAERSKPSMSRFLSKEDYLLACGEFSLAEALRQARDGR
jgi:hypothetical protein